MSKLKKLRKIHKRFEKIKNFRKFKNVVIFKKIENLIISKNFEQFKNKSKNFLKNLEIFKKLRTNQKFQKIPKISNFDK